VRIEPPIVKPRALRPGDTLGIVSPASSLDPERLDKGRAVIEARGYRTKLYTSTLKKDFYLAGTDEERAADLMAAFEDAEAAAVICSRGGYGCARLLPLIDLERIVAARKMFLGFSDITTLHVALNNMGLVTMHAPMPITLSYDRAAWVYDSFFRLLQGDPSPPDEAPRAETVVPGVAEGRLTGGCMCLLSDSLATAHSLDADGRLLIIEDVDENPHRVDAMFTHFYNAGILQRAAGVIVGEMTNTDEKQDPTIGGKPWRDIVHPILEKAGRPAVTGFPFGHMKTMLSVPLGVRARLDADAGRVSFLEQPCA
jgi:muramoyltetrapeptide carboxypeptidase